jgi:hypothetical protein
MPQWQYRTINLGDLPRGEDEIDVLNDAGEEGWELVRIAANNVAYLKRQIARPVGQSLHQREHDRWIAGGGPAEMDLAWGIVPTRPSTA